MFVNALHESLAAAITAADDAYTYPVIGPEGPSSLKQGQRIGKNTYAHCSKSSVLYKFSPG